MMREFETIFWVCLNTKEEIDKIIQNTQVKSAVATTQNIRSRLVMTAYYTKQKLCDQRGEEAISKFFVHNFDQFVSKHAAWQNNEKEDLNRLIHITPRLLNSTKQDLLEVYKNEVAKKEEGEDKKRETNIFH